VPRRILLFLPFVIIYTAALAFALQPEGIHDPDLGWHLRTGDWIFAHGHVPTTDPFSRTGEGHRWIAYSWLAELILASLYKTFGLVGVLAYTAALSVAIVAALHVLLRQLGATVEKTFALLGFATLVLGQVFTPRPWLFSILLFIVVFSLLVRIQRGGGRAALFFLPVVFALWANVHLLFIYGLVLVGLYAVEPMLDDVRDHALTLAHLRAGFQHQRWLLLAACLTATLLSPYGWTVYLAVLDIARDTSAFRYVTELEAMRFRSPGDWVVLALTLAAAVKLGWQREHRPFPLLLLAVAAAVSFRSGRDAWMVTVAAVSILAPPSHGAPPAPARGLAVAIVALVLVLIAIEAALVPRLRDLSETRLQADLDGEFPAAAVRFVEARHYPGPLYNHFNWGGYLIWKLPRLKVSIDGRTNLYGEKGLTRAATTWNGTAKWSDDPELAGARLVIAPVDKPLTSLLARDDRFQEVYRDAVAAVFVATPRAGDR